MSREQDLFRLVLRRLATRPPDPVALNDLLEVFVDHATAARGADATYSFVLGLPVEPVTTTEGASVVEQASGHRRTAGACHAGARDPRRHL